jgi:phosphoserine phosphatase
MSFGATREGVDNSYYKNLLNFYLNVKINPKVDWSFLLGQYPYLGYLGGETVALKIAAFDVDGVLEKEGSDEFSNIALYKLAKENTKILKRMPEIAKYVKILQTMDGIDIGKRELSRIFRDCNLRESEYQNACEEAVKEFVKHSLISGAKTCIKRLRKKMGYESALLSAAPHEYLELLAEYLGIPKENVVGTRFPFYNGMLRGDIDFLVGKRRLEGKNILLERKVSTKHGCYFIFDNDPNLNAPTLKSGLNPSILVGDFPREELLKLDFDVFSCCPEARENLTNIINPINRFEYGWVVANAIPKEAISKAFRLSYNQRRLFDQLEIMDVAREEYSSLRDQFVSVSLQILNLKDEFKLIAEDSEIRDDLWRLIIAKGNAKDQIKSIFEFFKTNVPETEALESQLYEIRSESNL